MSLCRRKLSGSLLTSARSESVMRMKTFWTNHPSTASVISSAFSAAAGVAVRSAERILVTRSLMRLESHVCASTNKIRRSSAGSADGSACGVQFNSKRPRAQPQNCVSDASGKAWILIFTNSMAKSIGYSNSRLRYAARTASCIRRVASIGSRMAPIFSASSGEPIIRSAQCIRSFTP